MFTPPIPGLSKHLCKMSPLGGLHSLIPVTHLGTLLFFVVTHGGWWLAVGAVAGCCGLLAVARWWGCEGP